MTGIEKQHNMPLVNSVKKRTAFYGGFGALLALMWIKNFWEIPIPALFLLAVFAVIALFADQDEMMALAVCCIPMEVAFQYKYALLVWMALYAFKYYREVRVNRAVILLLLMMVWELLHAFWLDFSVTEYFRIFAELIFCTFLLFLPKRKGNYPFLCRILAFTSCFMMLLVLLNLLKQTNFDFSAVFTGSYRFGVGNEEAENYGVNYNPNQLGFICNLSVAALLQLVVAKQHRKTDYLLITLLILFGIMTMSRTFLVCLALVITLFLFAGSGSFGTKCRRAFLIVLALIGVFLLSVWLMPEVVELFFGRFDVDDLTTGRMDLMAFYGQHLLSSPRYWLFGIGLQHYGDTLDGLYGIVENVPHNGIQELLVTWGVFGLLLFGAFVVCMIASSAPMRRKNRLNNFLPLILILVYVQAGQLISNGIVLLAFALAYWSLCENFEEDSADDRQEIGEKNR